MADTEEIAIDAETLNDLAYGKLTSLVEDELGNSKPEIEEINKAEFLIKIMKELIQKPAFIILRINYKDEE